MTGEGGSEVRSAPIPWSATAGLLSEGPRWHAERGELLWVESWVAPCTGPARPRRRVGAGETTLERM